MGLFDKIISHITRLPEKGDPKESYRESCKIIGEGVRSKLDGPLGEKVRKLIRTNWPQSEILPLLTDEIIDFIYQETMYHARLYRDIQKGLLQKYPHLTKDQAKTIVHSVGSKANSVFTRVEEEDAGGKWYEWSTCKDQRVRPSHRKMEGVLVPWSEPPSPERLIGKPPIGTYHAGEGIECRCCALPVIDPDYQKFPRRVYWDGQIRVMKKAEFIKIFGQRNWQKI